MKNIDQTTARYVPQIPEVTKSSNTQKPVKVVNALDFEDKASNIEDKVTLSSNVPQLPVTYSNIQIKPTKDIKIDPARAEIILPPDKSYIDFAKIKTIFSKIPLNINNEDFKLAVAACDSLDEIVDILKWSKESPNKNLLTSFVIIIATYCSIEKINDCRYLTNSLELKIYPNGGTVQKGMETTTPFYKFKPGNKLDKICPYMPTTFETRPEASEYARKFQGKLFMAAFAFVKNNVKIIDHFSRFILSNAESALKCTESNVSAHETIISALHGVVDVLTPNYQNQFISKFSNYFTKVPAYAAAVSKLLIDNSAYELTAEILQGNIPEFDGNNDKEIAFQHYNLAQALINLDRYKEALPHGQKAYNNLPGDPEALKCILHIVNELGRDDLHKKIIDNLGDGPLKNLLVISHNVDCLREKIHRDILKGIAEKDLPTEFHIALHSLNFINFQINNRSDNSGKIINPVKFRQELENVRTKRGLDAERTLALCLYFMQELSARSLLNEINTNKIGLVPILQRYKAFLETGEDNSQLVQEIASYPIRENEKADLHLSAASSCIVAENFQSASDHLQAAIEAQPENEDYRQASFLAAVLTDDQARIKSSFNKLDNETKEEIFSTFTHETEVKEVAIQTSIQANTTDTMAETDFAEVKFDHQKIHAHFQAIKAQNLNELSVFNKSAAGWEVGNIGISASETIPLGKHNGLKYFGYIAEKFQGSNNQAFADALVKGFAKRAEGVNGVKALKGVFEIKIDGNARLFTHKVYKNEQGQLLLCFDRYGNHDAVKLFAKNNKREIINC